MNLGIISPDPSEACYIYRGHPWTRIDGVHAKTHSGKTGFNLWQVVIESDAVLLLRPFTKQQLTIASTIKNAGKPLIIDFDDSYVNICSWNPNRKSFEGCKPIVSELARMADVVTVSSAFLADEMKSYGANVVLIKNAIDDSLRGIKKAKERTKTLIWRGGNSHSADMESGKEVFFDFAKRGYEIIFFGDAPPWAYQVKHRHFPATDYVNFLTSMAAIAPEYFFVPLVDHPFNHAKSDCSASEAYLIGAKLIHSNFGEFKDLPEVSEPRWLSTVNHLRSEVIRNLTPTD